MHWSVVTQQVTEADDTVMDILLRFGADLSLEEMHGLTPVEYASFKKVSSTSNKLNKYETSIELTEEGLRKMLERGGHVNWRDSQGNSLLNICCTHNAVLPMKFLIEHHANLNVKNLYGLAAIHLACISHFKDGLKLLLDHNAAIDIQDNMGYTPLHVAVMFNVESCVEVLLNHGANPNLRSFPSSGSVSALHLAACLGYEGCAEKLLLKGSDPNMEDEDGQTPISITKRFDTPILPLLKKYTDLNKVFQWCKEPARRPDIEQKLSSDMTLSVDRTNGDKMTMLHIATIAQNLPVVEILLAHHANFDLADGYGNTPIDIANGTEKMPLVPSAKNEKIHQRFLQYRRINALNDFILSGSLPDVKRLLKESPTEYNLHVHNGMAPLHIAAKSGYVAICKRLMKGGAKIEFLTTTNKSPVDLAAEEGKVDCLRMLLADPAGRAAVNAGDAQGDTPLILCVKKSPDTLEETSELLLSNGAEVEQKNRDGLSAKDLPQSKAFKDVLTRHSNGIAILEAAKRGDSKRIDEIFELPEEKRPAADFQDLKGRTALHYACASQEGESCVSILLQNGAHIEIRDREEKTPVDVLLLRPHTERTERFLTQYVAGVQVSMFAVKGLKQRMQQIINKYKVDVDFCDQIQLKTPLHYACISGSRTCVDFLVSQGATIDAKDKNSETPLFIAVRYGYKDIIEVLLESGANPEISDACGIKLIDSICEAKARKAENIKIALKLIDIVKKLSSLINIAPHEEKEVEKNLEESFNRIQYERATLTPEITVILEKHINGRKFVAEYAAKGDLARLRDKCKKYPSLLNYKCDGETALHQAVKKGFVDVVEDLLEQGALVSIPNNANKTVVDIANEMLEKQENTSKITKILGLLHKYGCGPEVVELCQNGKADKLEEILAKNVPLGFDVDYKLRGDFTALHTAAARGHLNCVEVLLTYKASPDVQDADGFTPLHYAARWGRADEMKSLLIKGVNIEQKNDQGLTPIMMAAIGEHNLCLQILTSFGAENYNKRTPLMLASITGFTECVKQLLEKGADPNLIDNSRNTALHYATNYGHVEIIKLLLATSKIDPNRENRMEHSPIVIATAKGNVTLLGILLSSKATDPNYGSKMNAVFVAIQNSSIECLKVLLERNADANKRVDGITPLHIAVMLGEIPTIEMLLNFGADPLASAEFTIGDEQFKLTPLDVAEIAHEIGMSVVPVQLLRCNAGAKAIQEAISKGEITALKQLLADYSDTNIFNYQDRKGKTPLHWACDKEYVSCIRAILAFYPNLNVKDKDGNVPMAVAKKHRHTEVIQELQRYENATNLLKEATDGNETELRKIIDQGDVDLEFSKPDKNTVVHLCAAYGYVGCLKLLLVKASHLANRQNSDGLLPVQVAVERGHLACVQELLPTTNPGGTALHEDLWTRANKPGNEHKDIIWWLQSDLCSHKNLPTKLFPANLEIEYHFGDLVGFVSASQDVSLYELEQQLYSKLKRYTILEQRIQQGRTQIRDDVDLKKAIETAKKENTINEKTTVVFHCIQNLENKPISQPRGPDNPNLKPITKLRSGQNESVGPNKTSTTSDAGMSHGQFTKLKEVLSAQFASQQKELDKELRNLANLMRYQTKQTSDIYDDIQDIKARDREFI